MKTSHILISLTILAVVYYYLQNNGSAPPPNQVLQSLKSMFSTTPSSSQGVALKAGANLKAYVAPSSTGKLLFSDDVGNLSVNPSPYDPTNGNLNVNDLSASRLFSVGEIHSDNRLHLIAEENLYLLPKGGTVVSKALGASGNLTVEGDQTIGGTLRVDNVAGGLQTLLGQLSRITDGGGSLTIGGWKIQEDDKGNLVFNSPKGTAAALSPEGALSLSEHVSLNGTNMRIGMERANGAVRFSGGNGFSDLMPGNGNIGYQQIPGFIK